MDLYEEMVQLYLTVLENCFVLPQFHVSVDANGKPWDASIDFLALNLGNKRIEVVEVSKAASPNKAAHFAEMLQGSHRTNVEKFIGSKLNRDLNYSITWRFFVRRANVERLIGQPAFREYVQAGGEAQVTAIEDVFDALRDQMP